MSGSLSSPPGSSVGTISSEKEPVKSFETVDVSSFTTINAFLIIKILVELCLLWNFVVKNLDLNG